MNPRTTTTVDALQYTFNDIDAGTWLEKLAELFHTRVNDGIITIPAAYGSGFIQRISIEPGLELGIWKYTTLSSFTFQKEKGLLPKYFHICLPINTADLLVSNPSFPKLVHLPRGRNIVFFSSDATASMHTRQGKGLQAIDILFTYDWLIQAFDQADEGTQSFLHRLNEATEPLMMLDACSPAEYQLVVGMFDAVINHTKSLLHLKAEVYLLIANFFQRLAIATTDRLQQRIQYHQEIMMANKIITESLEAPFPGITVLAKKVALSESTLKRYYKLMFGQNIHVHYLEMKMEHAKRLLIERSISVNEVATILHYEKVSSFIESFKKHHGYSPGQLKKERPA